MLLHSCQGTTPTAQHYIGRHKACQYMFFRKVSRYDLDTLWRRTSWSHFDIFMVLLSRSGSWQPS